VKRPQLEWRKITLNCWTAYVVRDPIVSISLTRHRSWKRLGHKEPWRITVFGNPWVLDQHFADHVQAQLVAEGIARALVRAMSKVLRCR
jgi:hypothetical protein